jgi:hypothetical protein
MYHLDVVTTSRWRAGTEELPTSLNQEDCVEADYRNDTLGISCWGIVRDTYERPFGLTLPEDPRCSGQKTFGQISRNSSHQGSKPAAESTNPNPNSLRAKEKDRFHNRPMGTMREASYELRRIGCLSRGFSPELAVLLLGFLFPALRPGWPHFARPG